jgi:hypothetical protein
MLSVSTLFSQNVNRIDLEGSIVVKSDDLEGVTIYNTSSNKGTITDAEGKFKIKVTLNDEIEVSALQFRPSKLTITQSILDSKELKVFLADRINNLDEVIVLQNDLTGILASDVENVKLVEYVNFSFGSFNDYDMSADYKSGVVNTAIRQPAQFQTNFIGIIKLIVPSLFEIKSRDVKRGKTQSNLSKLYGTKLAEAFTHSYYTINYNIPEDKVNSFIVFVEEDGFNVELLQEKNELRLIEHLQEKSKQYLKSKN